jgi:hypothetical protein
MITSFNFLLRNTQKYLLDVHILHKTIFLLKTFPIFFLLNFFGFFLFPKESR